MSRLFDVVIGVDTSHSCLPSLESPPAIDNLDAPDLSVYYILKLSFKKKQTLYMETFSQIINDEKPVLVDFFAEWCGPCKMMAPELKRFADSNKSDLRVLKVDIDKNRDTATHFNIQGVPTLILFKKGKVLWRQSGAMNGQQLSAIIKSKIP